MSNQEVKAELRHRELAARTLDAGGSSALHWVKTGKVGKGIVDPDLLKVSQAFAEQEAALTRLLQTEAYSSLTEFELETAAGNAFIEWCKEEHGPMVYGNVLMSGYVRGVKAMGG